MTPSPQPHSTLRTSHSESIVLGGGCFWCTEAAYQLVRGVTAVDPGYAGGTTPDPTYYDVMTGRTGHAEVIQVSFDPDVISLRDILDIFWAIHDPTTKDRQGYDIGSEYRSLILYLPGQKETVESSLKEAQALWPAPIVTETAPLDQFYSAEEENRDFFKKYPTSAYCQIVINPKLQRLREKYQSLLGV